MALWIRPSLGFLQGFITYLIMKHAPLSFAGAISTTIVLTFPLIALQVKLPTRDTLALALRMLVAMGLVYGYTAYHLLNTHTYLPSFVNPMLASQCAFSAFIFFIFYCAAIEEKRFTFPYPTLFSETWQVLLKLSFGKILVLSTWALFWLGALLFELLNISLFRSIVGSTEFFYIMLPCFFGIAMLILHEHEDILTKLRNILLAFCRFLYPLFIVINLGFLLTVPFAHKPFSNFWEMTVLLNFLYILLFNGVYQAGLSKPPYSPWFCKLIYLSMILTFAYSLYVLKFPWQLMHDYGFKPELFLFIINLIILVLYNASHCMAIFFSKNPWLSRVKASNTRLGVFVALVYLFLAMPWFPLAKFASEHQLARLLNHQAIVDPNHPGTSFGYLEGADLQGIDLHGRDLRYINFSNAKMEGANLSQANLENAQLSNAHLNKANLSGATLQGANITGADLSETNLQGTNFGMVWMYKVNLNQANLNHANLDKTYGLEQDMLNQACGENVLLPHSLVKKLTIKPCPQSSNQTRTE